MLSSQVFKSYEFKHSLTSIHLNKINLVIMCEITIGNGSRIISRMFHRRRPVVEGARVPLTMDSCSP
ncbi:hypothetical protein Sjap_007001 [Stephania japonica]|uniref:Uncharacterized protein n=1 Tax=Stephania japonica TaxID=461633 RepID=A0AAP0PJI1_9MAGN